MIPNSRSLINRGATKQENDLTNERGGYLKSAEFVPGIKMFTVKEKVTAGTVTLVLTVNH